MLDNLRRDYARTRELRGSTSPLFFCECLLFETGFQAVLLHRVAHWFKAHRVPFFGPFFGRLSQFLTGVEIGPAAEIGPGLFIGHASGIVIGGGVRMGARAFLLQQVTLGAPAPTPDRQARMPRLGDDVFLGAGAKVIGDVKIGDRVFIGAGALVTCDVPDDSRVLYRQELDLSTRSQAGEQRTV